MIELIFVIVILGILASVAIPRLAATREDAEISAAVANLRTLLNDANAYLVAKGSFNTGAGNTAAKWSEITNVPLSSTDQAATGDAVYLKAGGKDCIGVQLVTTTTPAHIKFTKNNGNQNNGVCAQVLKSDPLKPYFDSKIANDNETGKMAIGSSTSVYPPATAPKPAARNGR